MAERRDRDKAPWVYAGAGPAADAVVVELDRRETDALEDLLEWAVGFPGEQQMPLEGILRALRR